MRRLLVAAFAALALPATAQGAVREVKAVDAPGSNVWSPDTIGAYTGDTVRWSFAQPGNEANAQAHNVFLIKPGGTAEGDFIGSAQPNDTAVLDWAAAEVGTYTYYCSIHRDTMRGTLQVTAAPAPGDGGGNGGDGGGGGDAPPPPVDPVAQPAGPLPLVNAGSPFGAAETGDTVRPALSALKVVGAKRGARLTVRLSEAGSVTVRFYRGSRLAKTASKRGAKAGSATVRVSGLKPGRYRVRVYAVDAGGLRSAVRSGRVTVKP